MSTKTPASVRRLYVENYRSLGHVDITLEPLTVLVGPNGAGKTNFVDALRFVRDAITSGLGDAIARRKGIVNVRRRAADNTATDITIQVSLQGEGWIGDYGFTVSSPEGLMHVTWERFSVEYAGTRTVLETRDRTWIHWPGEQIDQVAADKIAIPDSDLLFPNLVQLLLPSLIDVFQFLSAMNFYTLYGNEYSAPQPPAAPRPLQEDGQNLAAVLRDLRLRDKHHIITEALGRVRPSLGDYTVEEIGGYLVTRLQHSPLGSTSSPLSFELAHESAGTLRMLALLAALFQDPPRSLITLEEPDSMLHDPALGILSDVLLEASLRSQLIITTHSPELVARVPIDALRVVENQRGLTYIGPIDDVQRAAVTQHLFTTGDLMRIEGLHRQARRSEPVSG